MAGNTSRFVNAYITPLTLDVTSDSDAVAKIIDLRRNSIGSPEYDIQLMLFNTNTQQYDLDISQYVVSDEGGSVKWDSTAQIPNSVTFNLAYDLQWGSDRVMVYALVRNRYYNLKRSYDPSTWIRFPLGRYVVTTPGFDDMDTSDFHAVTGYGLNYLLQVAPQDSYSFNVGSTYLAAVTALFRASGVLGSSAALSTICDYTGDWAAKTLAQPVNYAIGTFDFLVSAINDLLANSGQMNTWVHPLSGRWQIQPISPYITQPVLWTFAGDDDPAATDLDLDTKTVVMHSQSYSGDVYNLPNRWIFIQNGLNFQPKLATYPQTPGGPDPALGGGIYQVDNDSSQSSTQANDPNVLNHVYVSQPPSDQTTVGRVVPVVVMLDASGQKDLKTQGDKIVADALASVETISINTTPWPVGRFFDIFYFIHSALPGDSRRRCQAQNWEYDLFGGDTVWSTNAVSFS